MRSNLPITQQEPQTGQWAIRDGQPMSAGGAGGALAGNSVHLAEQAGGLLTAKLPGINRTSELVPEIDAASGEQGQSVGQITGAMNHLSATSQQTASTSEQLSATAEQLNAQSARLQDTVRFFTLAEVGPEQRPAARAAAPARAEQAAPRVAATVLDENQFTSV